MQSCEHAVVHMGAGWPRSAPLYVHCRLCGSQSSRQVLRLDKSKFLDLSEERLQALEAQGLPHSLQPLTPELKAEAAL